MTVGSRTLGVVDDSKSVVNSIVEYLRYSGKTRVVITAFSAEEMLAKLKTLKAAEVPEVVVTDVNMPGMGGIEFVRRGRALYPDIRFIMLSAHEEEEILIDAIQAGASGYLIKDESMAEIEQQIVRLFDEGGAPMSPRMARKALDLLAKSGQSHQADDVARFESFNLSPREQDVLQLLVQGHDYKEIAKTLFISPHTVRKHIANTYEKLHISSKAQAINLMHSSSLPTRITSGTDSHKIVLVDDHQIILESLSMMMSTVHGFSVAGVINDSRKVVQFLRDHDVDLVISDISMPYLDGLRLAGDIIREFPEIRIILLTVSEDQETMHEALDLGVHGYVLKKASKEELTRAMQSVLKGKKYFNEIAIN